VSPEQTLTAEASPLAAVRDEEVVIRPLFEFREELRVVPIAHLLRSVHNMGLLLIFPALSRAKDHCEGIPAMLTHTRSS
jgi:hypothetical protein